MSSTDEIEDSSAPLIEHLAELRGGGDVPVAEGREGHEAEVEQPGVVSP